MSSGILQEFEPLAVRAAREAIRATVAVMDKKIQVLEGARLTPRGVKHALHMGLIDPEMQDLLDDPDFKPLLNGHVLRRDEIGAVIERIERRKEECYSLANEEDPKTTLLLRHISGETTLLEGEVQQILDLMEEREVLIVFENPSEAGVQKGAVTEYYEQQQLAWDQARAVRALTHDQAKRAINFVGNKARQNRSRRWRDPSAQSSRKPRPPGVISANQSPAEPEVTEDERKSIELLHQLRVNPQEELKLLGFHEDELKQLMDQVKAMDEADFLENQKKVREKQLERKNQQIKDCWGWIRKVASHSLPLTGIIRVGETLSLILDRELTHLAHLIKEIRVLSQETEKREHGPKIVPLPPAPEKPPALRLRATIKEFEAWHSEPPSDSWPPQLPRIKRRKKPGHKTNRKVAASTENKESGGKKKKGKDKAAQEGKKRRGKR